MQERDARSGRKLSRLPPMAYDARLKGRALDASRTSALAPAPAHHAFLMPAETSEATEILSKRRCSNQRPRHFSLRGESLVLKQARHQALRSC